MTALLLWGGGFGSYSEWRWSGLRVDLGPRAALAQSHASEEGHGTGHTPGGGSSSSGGGHGGGHGKGRGRGRADHESGVHEPGGRSGSARGGRATERHVPGPVVESAERGSISGAGLARLNAARAFLAPGFDPARLEAEEAHDAPLTNINEYRLEMLSADPNPDLAGAFLGRAATIEVTPEAVAKVNAMVGVSVSPSDLAVIAASAEATRLERKDDHETTTDGHGETTR